jgi:hypothetical protein
MSTNYTGNPTATQSPASPPGPGVAPETVLPADGDPLNAASVAQAFKVLADYEAWLTAPKAIVGNWIEPVLYFRNANGHRRFLTDHQGFPAGKYQIRRTTWVEQGLVSFSSLGTAHLTGSWSYELAGSNTGSIASAEPNVALPDTGNSNYAFSPHLFVTTPFVGFPGGTSIVLAEDLALRVLDSDDHALFMQWDYFDHNNVDNFTEVSMGLIGGPTFIGNASKFASATPVGAAFVKRQADTNWFAYTNEDPAVGGTGPVYTATGVSATPGARQRFRIDIIGPNESDDGNPHVIFQINGSQVAKVDTLIGSGGSGPQAMRGHLRVWSGDNANNHVSFGLTEQGATTWPGDVGA